MKINFNDDFSFREACLIAIASFMSGIVVSHLANFRRRPPMPPCPPPMPPRHPKKPRF